jgi:spermidine/putrescine transport system substrate-binding protein
VKTSRRSSLIAAALMVALLAGCQKQAQTGQAADKAANKAAGPVQTGGNILRIFMWSDYIDPEVVKAFEKKQGVRVMIDTFESNEAMLAKLQGGGSGYDLVTPSNYFVQTMVRARLLAPIRTALLPNFANIAPGFLNASYDPGNVYTVPYQFSVTGLAYNSARYTPPNDSWSLIFGPTDTLKFVLLDDPREVIGAALKYQGHSVNSSSVPELRAARGLLRKVVSKRGFLGFDGGPSIRNRLLAGDIDLGQIYVGDLLQGAAENPKLKVFLPREGTTISTDTLVLLATSPNPALARTFIDTVLSPEVSAAITNFTFYGDPNLAAQPLLDPVLRGNPASNPPQADLKSGKVEFVNELLPGKPPRLYDRIWTELKSR